MTETGPDPATLAAARRCVDELEPLVVALEEIDGRLDVGLNYAAYGERVGDASVAYNSVAFESLSPACVTEVGASAEKALNSYLRASNVRDECFDDPYCLNEDIETKLQNHYGWTRSGTALRRSKRLERSERSRQECGVNERP